MNEKHIRAQVEKILLHNKIHSMIQEIKMKQAAISIPGDAPPKLEQPEPPTLLLSDSEKHSLLCLSSKRNNQKDVECEEGEITQK